VRQARSLRMGMAMLAFVALAVLAGCATVPPPAPPAHTTPPAPAPAPATPPSTGSPVGTTASGGTIRVNPPPPAPAPATTVVTTPAVVDSTPSADAIAVLKTIPEPLGGSTPAAPEVIAPAHAESTLAAPDSTRLMGPEETAPDTSVDSTGVPVPEPTTPLGDKPGSLASAALPESLAAAAPATAAPSPASPPSAATAAHADTCWRVQVAAPPERDRGDRMAEAARSQLGLAIVVEREGGLYKVRTRDCYPSATADELKKRAVASGFAGAFRFVKKAP